jgi:hypothetical protein
MVVRDWFVFVMDFGAFLFVLGISSCGFHEGYAINFYAVGW